MLPHIARLIQCGMRRAKVTSPELEFPSGKLLLRAGDGNRFVDEKAASQLPRLRYQTE